ncbi:hypothetical protein TRFO_05861 [Tritrichomonas foetus]|uniref:Tc1-like transposase DDE domain-containing protein n=1 Tax=Tritrichomonas foetus TaxID=1144522 RepID=A0A1J4K419_9EUKA|nr:hypothetical protein TRFO_05861 [Tritrichomonas foetus]|eukprot:OHT05706.1 hypothetical protein TRFO_05861 [Tritrichomonas foetus]
MGRGKNIKPDKAQKIYETFVKEGNKPARALCESYGYKTSTFYKILSLQGKIEVKHCAPPPKWSEDQIDLAINYIENVDNQVTYEELINIMTTIYNFETISVPTLWKYLDNKLFTVRSKIFYNYTKSKNSNEAKNERFEFMQWFVANQNKTLLYISEFPFNINTTRRQVKQKEEDPNQPPHPHRQTIPKTTIAQNQATTRTICMCFEKSHGTIFHDHKAQFYDGDDVSVFIANLIPEVENLGLRNICLLLDNLHAADEEEIRQVCFYAKWEYKFLPPNVPMVELFYDCNNTLKSNIKMKLNTSNEETDPENANALTFIQKSISRQQLLEKAVQASVDTITPLMVLNCWTKLVNMIPKVIMREDF